MPRSAPAQREHAHLRSLDGRGTGTRAAGTIVATGDRSTVDADVGGGGDALAPHEIAHASTRDASTVDEWGRDATFVRALSPLAAARWDVSVGGAERIAPRAALVVVNTRRLALTPMYAAWALSEALERPVRFVGRPDVVPLGPFLRRVGALLALPDEIAGALRAGEVVVLGATSTTNPRHVGAVDHTLVAAAVRERAPIHLAATLSTMTSRQARVEVGEALRTNGTRRGPLAELELAEHAQLRLQAMVDELGPTRSGAGWLRWGLPQWNLLHARRARS